MFLSLPESLASPLGPREPSGELDNTSTMDAAHVHLHRRRILHDVSHVDDDVEIVLD